MAKTDKTDKTEKITFTKEQICSSNRYSRYVDILSITLEDGKLYSYDDIDKTIDEFMKGKVK